MNRIRRKEIQEIIVRVENLVRILDDVNEQVDSVKAAEEESRDNIPENLQYSERYERADSVCDALDSALDSLFSCQSDFEDLISYLNEATEI